MKYSSHRQTNISESTCYEVCGVVKLTNTESRTVATKDWGAAGRRRGSEGLAFNGFRVSFWEKKKVLEMDSGDG